MAKGLRPSLYHQPPNPPPSPQTSAPTSACPPRVGGTVPLCRAHIAGSTMSRSGSTGGRRSPTRRVSSTPSSVCPQMNPPSLPVAPSPPATGGGGAPSRGPVARLRDLMRHPTLMFWLSTMHPGDLPEGVAAFDAQPLPPTPTLPVQRSRGWRSASTSSPSTWTPTSTPSATPREAILIEGFPRHTSTNPVPVRPPVPSHTARGPPPCRQPGEAAAGPPGRPRLPRRLRHHRRCAPHPIIHGDTIRCLVCVTLPVTLPITTGREPTRGGGGFARASRAGFIGDHVGLVLLSFPVFPATVDF